MKTQFSKYNDTCKILKTQFSQPDVINFQKKVLILNFWNIYYNFVFRNFAGALIFRKIFLVTQQFVSADWEKKSWFQTTFASYAYGRNIKFVSSFSFFGDRCSSIQENDKILITGQDVIQFLKYLKFMHEIARPFRRMFRNPRSIFFRVFSNLEHSVMFTLYMLIDP